MWMQATENALELVARIRAYTNRAPTRHFHLSDEEAALAIDELVRLVARDSFYRGYNLGKEGADQ